MIRVDDDVEDALDSVLFSWVFGAVFLLTGGIPLFIAIKTFRKDRAIARWPRAPGKITISFVKTSTGTAKDKNGYAYKYTRHEPVVTYTYTLNGQELTGDCISRHGGAASSHMSTWPTGKDVAVLYDPNDPKTAYLETRVSVGAVILAVMGGVFAFVGLLVPALVNFAG
jgi:hypothetical protein